MRGNFKQFIIHYAHLCSCKLTTEKKNKQPLRKFVNKCKK